MSVIALSAWAVVRLGVLRVGLASLAGQLAGGLAIDAAWPQAGGGAVRPATVVAVVLAFLGVALSRDRLEPAGRPSAGSGSVGGPAAEAVAP